LGKEIKQMTMPVYTTTKEEVFEHIKNVLSGEEEFSSYTYEKYNEPWLYSHRLLLSKEEKELANEYASIAENAHYSDPQY
jgi:hypothetical protein